MAPGLIFDSATRISSSWCFHLSLLREGFVVGIVALLSGALLRIWTLCIASGSVGFSTICDVSVWLTREAALNGGSFQSTSKKILLQFP